ncbi:MAG TPA: response regulator [Ruminiclostridium sp.]
MLKAMLVDDELLEREGIRDLIPWEQLGVELAGEASCATKALEMAKRIEPDIIITDIKMPGKNGIELVSQLKAFLPDIKVIFISGYQDFEYAKNAIALDAYGYVLKPVDEIELINVIRKVVNHYDEIRNTVTEKRAINCQIEESLPLLQQQFVKNLLTGNFENEEMLLWEQIKHLKLSLQRGYYYVAAISLDDYKIRANNLSRYDAKSISHKILKAWECFRTQGVNAITVQMQEDLYALIINDTTLYYESESVILTDFRNFISKFNDEYGMAITIGLSRVEDELSCLCELYGQAVDAIKHKWYLGKGSIILASHLNEDFNYACATEEKGNIDLLDIQKNVSKCIFAGDSIGIENTIRQYLDGLSTIEKKNPQNVQNLCLDLINCLEHILMERGEKLGNIFKDHIALIDELLLLDTLSETELWMVKKFRETASYMASKNNEPSKWVINKIIEIIESRYFEELTVEDFAQEVFLSPNYIRKIFKNVTGKTILEYITQTRMNKAINLMKTSYLNTREIAIKVGYESTSYFGQIFKQNFGVTPGEYVKSMERV